MVSSLFISFVLGILTANPTVGVAAVRDTWKTGMFSYLLSLL